MSAASAPVAKKRKLNNIFVTETATSVGGGGGLGRKEFNGWLSLRNIELFYLSKL
jgi:hypothetical protein